MVQLVGYVLRAIVLYKDKVVCVEYIINGKIISTQKELIEIFPIENVVFFEPEKDEKVSDGYYSYDPDSCLCPVDAFETGKKNNVPVIRTAMYYHFGEDEINKAIEWEKKQVGGGWWTYK